MKIYIARDADRGIYGFKNYPRWDGRAWHSEGWCKEFPTEDFPDIKMGECRVASIQSIPVGEQEVIASPAPDTKGEVFALDKFINDALAWFEFDIATSEGGLKELKEWEREEFRYFMTQRMRGGKTMKGGNITKSGDILKEWLSENSEITLPEENRTKLLDLLKRLEKNDDQLRDVKKMVIDKACEWLESHFRDIENPDFYSKRNHPTDLESMYHWSVKELVNDFRKSMEE